MLGAAGGCSWLSGDAWGPGGMLRALGGLLRAMEGMLRALGWLLGAPEGCSGPQGADSTPSCFPRNLQHTQGCGSMDNKREPTLNQWQY